MSQEVYFNSGEINLFRNRSIENVDFLLPNSSSIEKIETANFLTKFRLTRQFQRTLDSLRTDSKRHDSGISSKNGSVNDELEEILFQDENEEEKRATLEHFFFEWRTFVEIRKV